MRTTFDSPIGSLTLLGNDRDELERVLFPNEPYTGDEPDDPAALTDARAAFERYFAADASAFAGLALRFGGTPFQRAVWDALIKLPFGQTTTYGELASSLPDRPAGHPTSARAIGSANARTPIPIVMACHRVIGSTGALTGYRGGLKIKRALLAFESSGGDLGALRDGLAVDEQPVRRIGDLVTTAVMGTPTFR
jgi:methylated-DNA-[protein]-cysteine S-methyltransferase